MSSEEIQRYDELMAKCERESAEILRLLDTMKEQVVECRRTVAECLARVNAIEKRVPPLVLESALASIPLEQIDPAFAFPRIPNEPL